MHVEAGIVRFKCATIAEMEMVALSGGADVLLAHQPVGPTIERVRVLADRFPDVRFSVVVDDETVVDQLSAVFSKRSAPLEVYIDIDNGQHRTGLPPGAPAVALYRRIARSAGLIPGGIHAYDGHRHEANLDERTARCDEEFTSVLEFRRELEDQGLSVPSLVVGGSPSFPIHARHEDRVCSPGTTSLWDFSYSDLFPDLPFEHAAVLLTRVISKPCSDRVTLDLGHKAVAADKAPPRARVFGLEDAVPVIHSEEHLTVQTPRAAEFEVGDCLYAIPGHVCPTVALHEDAWVVRDGRAGDRWKIEARRRRLSL
jgi:D-serine deaminase-like pyridoxal phosphate-dependent protein